jgi:hypothetical protein
MTSPFTHADIQLFRIWYNPRAIICSDELRSALLAAVLSGIELEKLRGDACRAVRASQILSNSA